MSDKFNLIIPYVFVNEGTEWSNDQYDSGNWTGGKVNSGELKGSKYGISAATYPNLNIQELTEDQAKAIYEPDYYDKINGDNLPSAIGFLMLDAAINSGIKPAVEWIQTILNLFVDGDCGPVTQAAITNYTDQSGLCQQYAVSHLLHYMQFSNWSLYKDGYTKRIIFDSMTAQRLLDMD